MTLIVLKSATVHPCVGSRLFILLLFILCKPLAYVCAVEPPNVCDPVILSKRDNFSPCTWDPNGQKLFCQSPAICDFPEFDSDVDVSIRRVTLFGSQITRLNGSSLNRKVVKNLQHFLLVDNTAPTFEVLQPLPFPDLQSLTLGSNEINLDRVAAWPRIPVLIITEQSMSKLNFLSFNGMHVTLASEIRLPALSWLAFTDCVLHFPNNAWGTYTALNRLNLTRVRFDGSPSLDFLSMPRLDQLNYQNSQLEAIPAFLLNNLPQLEVLNLAGNNLTQLPANCFHSQVTSLRVLDLSRNKLLSSDSMEGLKGLEKLEALYLAACEAVNAVPLVWKKLPQLNDVNLDRTSLTDFNSWNFSPKARLKRLSMKYVSSQSVKFTLEHTSLFSTLQLLDMSFNEINKIIRFESGWRSFLQILTSIKELQFRNCRLENNFLTQEMPTLPTLERLGLQYNPISALPRNLSVQLPSLKVLSLDNTPLESFPVELLDEWHYLESISIASTNVLTLENCSDTLWRRPTLLKVNHNSFHCDCQLAWFVELWLRQPEEMMRIRPVNVTCRSPPGYAQENIFNVPLLWKHCRSLSAVKPLCSAKLVGGGAQVDSTTTMSSTVPFEEGIGSGSSTTMPMALSITSFWFIVIFGTLGITLIILIGIALFLTHRRRRKWILQDVHRLEVLADNNNLEEKIYQSRLLNDFQPDDIQLGGGYSPPSQFLPHSRSQIIDHPDDSCRFSQVECTQPTHSIYVSSTAHRYQSRQASGADYSRKRPTIFKARSEADFMEEDNRQRSNRGSTHSLRPLPAPPDEVYEDIDALPRPIPKNEVFTSRSTRQLPTTEGENNYSNDSEHLSI